MDVADHGLTGEQAQAIGMEYAEANFPGHQALVCTHTDGSNNSGNIHTHIIINSLRKEDIAPQPYPPLPPPMDKCWNANGLLELHVLIL